MKILELEIENFRSLKKAMWKPGDLNVIIGRNGSGKSNLLRFIELMSASAKGDFAEYISSSGGMNALLWDGKPNDINFQLKTTDLNPRIRGVKQDSFSYVVKITQVGRNFSGFVRSELLTNFLETHTHGLRTLKLLETDEIASYLYDETQEIFFTLDADRLPASETTLSAISSPFTFPKESQRKAYSIIRRYREQLSNWLVYQEIRTDKEAKIRQEVEVRAVKQVAPDGQNLVNVLHTLYESADDPDFRESLDDGMRAAFGKDYRSLTFSPDAAGRVQLGIRWHSLRRVNNAAAISDGTLRFLFLLTVLGNPSPAPLIAIDQPETGLHPRMLPIIAEYAAAAAKKTQVVFTTHSPEFLSAFDKAITPTTTVAMWADGETILQNLDGAELDYWLQKYTLGDLLESGELENMAHDKLEVAP